MLGRRQAGEIIQSDHSRISGCAGEGILLKEAAERGIIRPGPVVVEPALGIQLPPRVTESGIRGAGLRPHCPECGIGEGGLDLLLSIHPRHRRAEVIRERREGLIGCMVAQGEQLIHPRAVDVARRKRSCRVVLRQDFDTVVEIFCGCSLNRLGDPVAVAVVGVGDATVTYDTHREPGTFGNATVPALNNSSVNGSTLYPQ